ncbi:MAG: NAD-dependent epimerase/dehydratase family protein [Candidatus Methylomirabilis oxygeniifera]|uniref:NAD-dependent epimerase/dehydratase n=1 Tax=Methylomirabilis oxygeniifera TaxID=671143 RepID=D5MMA8_METO1|nr:MAG: NAD-dependent epimerase/dehydratase family protein [Candidatus Methylomirabilis oxyfera]CBE67994.1 NAD-dependent epimerase/dehydratase [Candidatus Methylomirabilis oxyfera]
MRYFVTGAAGFIGSNLIDRLLLDGHEVVGYDNFSTGQPEFLAGAQQSTFFNLVSGDTLDQEYLIRAMKGADFVVHLAANADVRFGMDHPRKDLEHNTIATFNVLEAMRANDIRRIAFSSTGSIYGEPDIFPTPEDAPFPIQTSLYGASKLAAEGLIAAYCEGFGFQGYIFRFVSILGERYTHGHVFDFYKQLRDHPDTLHVLGNGKQRKSYLYVRDCIDAMLLAIEQAQGKINIFNLGTDEYCQVNDSIGWICEYLGISPHLIYAGGERGWVGDSPFIFLDCSRIRALGWRPQLTIREGIIRTLQYLEQNPSTLERRH